MEGRNRWRERERERGMDGWRKEGREKRTVGRKEGRKEREGGKREEGTNYNERKKEGTREGEQNWWNSSDFEPERLSTHKFFVKRHFKHLALLLVCNAKIKESFSCCTAATAAGGILFLLVREELERTIPTNSSPVPRGPGGRKGPGRRLLAEVKPTLVDADDSASQLKRNWWIPVDVDNPVEQLKVGVVIGRYAAQMLWRLRTRRGIIEWSKEWKKGEPREELTFGRMHAWVGGWLWQEAEWVNRWGDG